MDKDENQEQEETPVKGDYSVVKLIILINIM